MEAVISKETEVSSAKNELSFERCRPVLVFADEPPTPPTFFQRLFRISPKPEVVSSKTFGPVTVITKEKSKDVHLHTSRQAQRLDLSNSMPLLLKKIFGTQATAVEFGVYLEQPAFDLKAINIQGRVCYFSGNEKTERKYSFDLNSESLQALDRPTYWIDFVVNLEAKLVSTSKFIEVYLDNAVAHKKSETRIEIISDAQIRGTKSSLPPLVLVVSLDGVSADDVHLSDNGKKIAPALSEFSKSATNFSRSVSSSSVTASSAACLMTGLSLSRHFLYDYDKWYHDPELATASSQILSLGEYAKAIGYNTHALTVFSKWRPHYGYSRGFDYFKNICSGPLQRFDLFGEAIQLVSRAKDTPTFALLHLPGAHPPFRARYSSSFSDAEYSSYTSTLSATDRQFAALMSHLKDAGLFDSALIFVLSDHGRAVRPYSRHGYQFDESRLRVPFIIKYPKGFESLAQNKNASNIISATTEVFRTMSEVLNQPLPDYFESATQRQYGEIYWASETVDYSNYKRLGLVGYDSKTKWVFYFDFDGIALKIGDCLEMRAFECANGLVKDSENMIDRVSEKQKSDALASARAFLADGLRFAKKFPPLLQKDNARFSKMERPS